MIMSDKERKKMKTKATKRLEYLVSWGLSSDMFKKFKSNGRVYVNEIGISDWADRNGKKNCRYPRTYVFTDTVEEITEEMLQTKKMLESEGYLIYLITRERRNSPKEENRTDRVDYFLINPPTEKLFYPIYENEFRNGKAKVYTKRKTFDSQEEYFREVNYEVRMEQVVIKEEN